MLERLSGNEYYHFLDGFLGFFQIPIAPKDQEKTTFTSPYGTFAYRRMPFGLCNAPATFQRCMTTIFHDMVEEFIEDFMDDSRYSEKCHFMVKEGIVLGHKISGKGIEVDKAKIDVIAKLPYPSNVKGVRIGAVLGQRIERKFKPINYASKTLNDAQANYTTTEKELLAVVFSFDKFCPYLILSKTIVYTDHSALKYLFRAENLAADHLSKLENPNMGELAKDEITDKFSDEHLMILKAKLNDEEPWINKYILVMVDYVSKWVEAQELPTNDARVVVKFLKGLFARFGVPKALISDRGTHFCNSQLEKALLKYGVTHKISTVYHPQTDGKTEVTNKAIKRILERSVGYNPKDWSEKLNDAMWHSEPLNKTSR
ncbi:reverse transcriptase domain-containing protein [Tanacetum coccineum]